MILKNTQAQDFLGILPCCSLINLGTPFTGQSGSLKCMANVSGNLENEAHTQQTVRGGDSNHMGGIDTDMSQVWE